MTQYFLKNIQLMFLILLIILLGGIYSFITLPRDEDPGFIIRTAVVKTQFAGAPPDRVELLVTDKLEKAIQEMPEIDYIKSQSKTGLSIIYVNILDDYKDVRPIWDELRRKVEKASQELPEEASTPFVDDEFGDVFGTIVTVAGEGFSQKKLKDSADILKNELLELKDIAQVNILGDEKEVIYLDFDSSRLAEFGINPSNLKNIIQNTNILKQGGNLKIGKDRIIIEPSGNFENINDISKIIISKSDTQEVVYLGDIVNIKRTYQDPPDMLVHSSGMPAIAISSSMKKQGNILKLGNAIKKKLS